MGYCTHYELETDTDDYYFYESELRKIVDYNPLETECKWDSHLKDMKELSSKYPKVLFTLHAEGEESGDVWKGYFKGGKAQIEKAVITIAEFNEDKLK